MAATGYDAVISWDGKEACPIKDIKLAIQAFNHGVKETTEMNDRPEPTPAERSCQFANAPVFAALMDLWRLGCEVRMYPRAEIPCLEVDIRYGHGINRMVTRHAIDQRDLRDAGSQALTSLLASIYREVEHHRGPVPKKMYQHPARQMGKTAALKSKADDRRTSIESFNAMAAEMVQKQLGIPAHILSEPAEVEPNNERVVDMVGSDGSRRLIEAKTGNVLYESPASPKISLAAAMKRQVTTGELSLEPEQAAVRQETPVEQEKLDDPGAWFRDLMGG